MTRRTYRYDKESGEMVEVSPTPRIPHGLLEDNFRSVVDGSIITNQRKLHDHNVRNNVQQVTPEVEHNWQQQKKLREDFRTKGDPRGRGDRIEALKHSLEVNTRRRR